MSDPHPSEEWAASTALGDLLGEVSRDTSTGKHKGARRFHIARRWRGAFAEAIPARGRAIGRLTFPAGG